MAITIQELIASDTISQAVDKINFNFDQLLLNGGGPVGPAGPLGPSGPIGGRGERGTEWYEGTDDPNVTPPTVTPLAADYYLQSNGDVWEYTGLVWSNTGINLKGPQGATGASIGWSQWGNSPNPGNSGADNYDATAKNVSYPALMQPGSNTISINNEGVPSVAFGVAGPNDNDYPGIPLTSAYQLTTGMAGQLDSSKLTALFHQKDSGSKAISFMGGGGIAGDLFEQNDLDVLSTIFLSKDDRLNIATPKLPSVGATVDDRIGFSIDSGYRGQSYRTGNGFSITTGTKGTQNFAADESDVTINVNSLTGASEPGKLIVKTVGTSASNEFIIGKFPSSGITPSPSYTGGVTVLTDRFSVASNSDSKIESASGVILSGGTGANTITASPTGVYLNATGSSVISGTTNNGNIVFDANNGDAGLYSDNFAEIKSGLNQITTQAVNGITIRTEGVNSDLKLDSFGAGGVTFARSNQSIYLMGFDSSKPYIRLAMSEPIPYTQFRGKQAWTANNSDTTNSNLSDQFILFDTDTSVVPESSTIQRFGGPGTFDVNDGVMFQKFQDGTGSIVIGKPKYPAGSPLSDRQGIFVNRIDGAFQQGSATASGGATSADFPESEQFTVSRDRTKISNTLIWGGHNGYNKNYFDPYASISPASNLYINSPYYRLVIARTSPVDSTNISSLNDNQNFNYNFDLVFSSDLSQTGQRVFVEVVNVPSKFTMTTSGGGKSQSYARAAFGTINLRYDPWDINGVNGIYSTAGSVISTAVTANPGGGWQSTIASRVFEFIFVGSEQTYYNSNAGSSLSQGIPVTAGWRYLGSTFGVFGGATGTVPSRVLVFDSTAESSGGGKEGA